MTTTGAGMAAPGTADDRGAPGGPGQLGGRAAWWALTLVGLTSAVSMIDRQVLAILVPRIKADLNVGDAEMGLLYGTVFALFYALFSLPLGRLADGWVRTRLLAGAIFVWSGMTALAGFANGIGLLALSRLGVGVGEAAVQPAGFSLLADRFPKHMKGTFTAVMSAAIALGLGGALWIGGSTAGAWDAAFPGGIGAPFGMKGWQAAFIAAALPGPILGVLLWRMPEPVRGAADGIVAPPDPHPVRAAWGTLAAILPGTAWVSFARARAGAGTWIVNIVGLVLIVGAVIGLSAWTTALREVNPVALAIGPVVLNGNELQWGVTGFGAYVLLCWLQSLYLADRPSFVVLATSPAMLLTLAIGSLQTLLNYGIQAWSASYIIRRFEADPATVGLQFGILMGGIGIIGPLLAGPLSDRLARRFGGGRIYVTLGALVLSPPLAFLVYRAETLTAFYALFSLYGFILTMWMPPIYAALLDLVLPRMRGKVMSFYLLLSTIVGMGLGPYTVGLRSDLNGGQLGEAILDLYWLGGPLVILCILLIRRLPKDETALVMRARAAGEPI
ncbi:MAG: MFS transporter [Sphingomonas fennica]